MVCMEYRKIGNTDLNVSKLGFGCMSLKPGMVDAEAILHEAVDLGINFFDTADLYDKGWNEELVGKALRTHRSKILISSKVGNQWREDGSGWDWDPRKSYILAAVEKSLRRLQTDHIDLYQLHGGTIEDPIDETIEAFELLKKQGKIRAYGISSIRPNVIHEWLNRSHFQSVMMQYSILDRRPEENCLQMIREKGLSVIARGSLAQGILIDKPSKTYLSYSTEDVHAIVAHLRSTGIDPTTLALQYVWQDPVVSTAVVGIRTSEQLKKAYDAAMAEKINVSLPFKPNVYQEHRLVIGY